LFSLVFSRDDSAAAGEEVYILSDGRKIHHQSRMYLVPRNYYKNERKLLHFFNLEYLEADGNFILRIIGTNARLVCSNKRLFIYFYDLKWFCCNKTYSWIVSIMLWTTISSIWRWTCSESITTNTLQIFSYTKRRTSADW